MQHARGIPLTETFYYFIIICSKKKKWRSTLMIFKCLWGLSNKYTHNKYICRTILFLLIYFCHRNVTSVYIQSQLSMHKPSKLYIDAASSPSFFLVVHNLLFHIKIRAIFPCTSVSLGTVLAPINQCKEVLQTCRNISESQICAIYSAVGLPETHIQGQDL